MDSPSTSCEGMLDRDCTICQTVLMWTDVALAVADEAGCGSNLPRSGAINLFVLRGTMRIETSRTSQIDGSAAAFRGSVRHRGMWCKHNKQYSQHMSCSLFQRYALKHVMLTNEVASMIHIEEAFMQHQEQHNCSYQHGTL